MARAATKADGDGKITFEPYLRRNLHGNPSSQRLTQHFPALAREYPTEHRVS